MGLVPATVRLGSQEERSGRTPRQSSLARNGGLRGDEVFWLVGGAGF